MRPLVLFLCLTTPVFAQPDWETVNLGTTEDLQVLSQGSARVYVAGANGFLSKADPTDYTSWTPMDMGTTETLISAIHVGSVTSLYVSGDGGVVRYRKVESDPWTPLDIPDATQAYIVHRIATSTLAAFGSAGGIYTNQLTGNGNPTQWVQRTSGTTVALHDADRFSNANYTLAVGDGGTILRSEDGGETWTPVASGTTADLHDIAWRNTTNWLIVGEGGLVLKSTDGGVTWTPRATGTTSTLYAIDDRSTLLAVGEEGTVLQSKDDGETWCHHDPGTTATLRAVANYNRDGWLVAGDGGLLLLSQTQGGNNCVVVAHEDGPESGYTLSDVWPNPIASRGTFSLSVDRPQRVTVDLVGGLGRRVRTLHDGLATPGEAITLTVEGGDLAPGVYVVHVQGETFTATRQVTIAR